MSGAAGGVSALTKSDTSSTSPSVSQDLDIPEDYGTGLVQGGTYSGYMRQLNRGQGVQQQYR